MNRLAHMLARVYPRQWRARYGREFDALLEAAGIRWRDLFDVLIAALRMRLLKEHFKENFMEPRIVELNSHDVPHGYELNSSVEYPREDGGNLVVRHFCRELDFGDSYITLNHWSRGSQPAQTVLIFGKKGAVEGDFRADETEMLLLRPDGSVQRTRQTVKTSLQFDSIRAGLREKYRSGMAAGLTPDEIHREIRASHGLEI